MTILEKIEQNAKNNPKRIAYIENGIKDGSVFQNVLTWKELSENSGVLANYLETHLKTKKPVVVYGHKSILMPICFLACAKSGRAYVPIDITVPASRVEDIINAVDPELVILTEDYESSFENIFETDKILSIINNEKEIISPAKWIEKDSVFYIIFTSGSTGKPKGVQITRDCLDNFIVWGITLFNYNEIQENGGVFINQAPFSFDLSVMDLYLSLYSGGTEFAISKKLLFETNILFDLFNKSEGVIWVSTPSFADVCLADKKFCQNLLPKLKTFLFCGETLSNRTAGKLLNLFPKAKVINTYGLLNQLSLLQGLMLQPN